MSNEELIAEARAEAARCDRDESTMEGELLTLLADALIAATAPSPAQPPPPPTPA